jgi:hypothetical protein
MNLRVTTATVLLVALICHVIANRPDGQCLFPDAPCIQNMSASGPPSKLIEPVIGGNPPPPLFPPPPPPLVFDEDPDWTKAVCRGRNLLKAMVLDEAETAKYLQWPYAESPWDGDLREALGKWGYRQGEYADQQCDFDKVYHGIERSWNRCEACGSRRLESLLLRTAQRWANDDSRTEWATATAQPTEVYGRWQGISRKHIYTRSQLSVTNRNF